MFSQRDDVTLANPLGPPVRGWNAVEETLNRVAAGMREGEPHAFERISAFEDSELACVFEIERSRAKLGRSAESAPFSLRAMTLWRREEGEWKIAFRHADPITQARPIESLAERQDA
jgi:ketosteroid isomerase-like protein